MTLTNPLYPRVLSIAGSDSSGGAGIQADLKTMTSLGCYGMTVITAVTAQNTLGVDHIEQMPIISIEAQFHSVLKDIPLDALKIGMIGNSETAELIGKLIKQYALLQQVPNIVLDPVLVASSGDSLGSEGMVEIIQKTLFPLCHIVTPNLIEAQTFLGKSISTKEEMRQAAMAFLNLGAKAVLIKGGHLNTSELVDVLAQDQQGTIIISEFSHPKIDTLNTHGTGCTLSSAIASFLAKKLPLKEAVGHAIDYTQKAILAAKGYPPGHLGAGHGPLWHLSKVSL